MDADRVSTARRGRGDDGFTLVEQLVTLVLLGIGVIAILGAILTIVSTSSRHRDLSDAAALAAASAERLASSPFLPCQSGEATAAKYTAAAKPPQSDYDSGAVPASATVTVGAPLYWTGSTFSATCQEGSGYRAQKLTVTAKSGVTTETLEIVKWA